MVEIPVKTWLLSPESFNTLLDAKTQMLDETHTRVSREAVLAIWHQFNPGEVTIKKEFSRVVCTQGTHQMRISFDQKRIDRVDISTALNPRFRYAMQYGYDGTLYYGSQIQPHKPTIQGEFEGILRHLFQTDVTLHPASRTDTGVHAHAAMAHFDAPFYMDPNHLLTLLNRMAPKDIVIHHVESVSHFFHARYDVLEKTYVYKFTRHKDIASVHKKSHLNISDMAAFKARLNLFKGPHDFRNFAKVPETQDTVRDVRTIDVTSLEDGSLEVTFTARGFLRHMIRFMMGAALKLTSEEIEVGLERPYAPIKKTLAPAEGLYLTALKY